MTYERNKGSSVKLKKIYNHNVIMIVLINYVLNVKEVLVVDFFTRHERSKSHNNIISREKEGN